MPFVRRSTLRALEERASRAEAMLAGERTARSGAEGALHRAIDAFADAMGRLAAAPAPAPHATPNATPDDDSAPAKPNARIELPPAVKDACSTYAFGSVREILANRRKARRLLADNMPENDVIRIIRQGAVPASREED